MALPNITFIKGQGGLGRALPGQDHISGMLFYTANLPSGFTTTSRVKALYSVSDAVNAGILNDYSDATASTGTVTITAAGSAGDTIRVRCSSVSLSGALSTITLGEYTRVGTETAAQVATAVAASINANTQNTGFSAIASGAIITITAPKFFGTFLNSGTPYTVQVTGGITTTIVQNVIPGVASAQAVWHYHVSEFFRMNPKGILYVGFYAVPGTYAFTEITLMQNFAQGAIRQIGVFKTAAYADSDIALIDAVCKANDAIKRPISAVYCANLVGTADITTLATLATKSNNKVSVCVSQSGSGQGLLLVQTNSTSITHLGTIMGTISRANVSESIAWVNQFNLSDGVQNEVAMFANGQYYETFASLDSTLEGLTDKRYIFVRKFNGISGTYFNDSHTAIAQSSDYAYIENNRVIDKAIRVLNAAYLPFLNSPISLNADGTLTDVAVGTFEGVGETALDEMVRLSNLNAYDVVVDPSQDVLSTSELVVAVSLLMPGVARQIIIPITFTQSIA
jgi:hypothetical protein